MEIRISQGLETAPEAAMIRKAVFIDEQGFENEFDDIDGYAFHAVLFTEDNIPAACGRLYSSDGQSFIIGRIAVLKPFRRSGLGEKIVTALENKARELGGTETELSAQVRAMGFYEKLGYSPFGEEYLDEYCPHIAMKKLL
ncbi:MAG: GNAT family N-acetyltransferase [Huintestinicola sp.]|uniref:GNAT family N-acetyltransferase n=1 Tax=Huintestinicola sp. TaxID=2981661 RepID=UPI003F049E99